MIKINDQLEVLKRLNSFSQCFGKITTIEELASSVSEVLEDLLEIESSGLYLYDFQEKRLKLLVAKGFTDEERAVADKTAMDRHPGYVFKTGRVLDIPDTENDPDNLTLSSKRSFVVRSRLYVPVLNGNEPVGAFGIVSSEKNRFTDEYQVVLSFICNIAGGVYATIVNNAEQKKAHDYLAAIMVRLETLIKNLQSGILVEDQDRKIALINKTFCSMFNIPVEPDLLFGADCSDSAEQSKGMFADPDYFVSRIDSILNEKIPVTGEELELADGRIFERDYIPIFLEGRFLGNLWQYRDISSRVLIEKDLPLALDGLIASAVPIFGDSIVDAGAALADFIFDRLSGSLREQGYSAAEVDAVLGLRPQRLGDVPKRLAAVRVFAALPEAPALAAANKRISNILKKAPDVDAHVSELLLREPAEVALYAAMQQLAPQAQAQFEAGDYTASLKTLAALRLPVDDFFDAVMVNADELDLRLNRQGLLKSLHQAMNRVADLSRLVA